MELSRRADLGRDLVARRLGGGPEAWAWRILNAGPEGRAVVEYRSANDRVIGKFDTAVAGAAAFHTLEMLSRAACPTLRVPTPYLHDAGLGLLVMSAAEGTPGPALDPERAAEAFRRVGRALSELHALPAGAAPVRRLRDHLAELVRPAPERLAEAVPEHAALIHDTLRRLRVEDERTVTWPVAPLHRDFHLRQLVDDGRCVHVLDWDLHAAGDPAFDVGYFTTYLKTHAAGTAAALGIEAFLDGYQPSPALLERLPLYERFNLLRRACRRHRLRDAGWETELPSMLDRLARLA